MNVENASEVEPAIREFCSKHGVGTILWYQSPEHARKATNHYSFEPHAVVVREVGTYASYRVSVYPEGTLGDTVHATKISVGMGSNPYLFALRTLLAACASVPKGEVYAYYLPGGGGKALLCPVTDPVPDGYVLLAEEEVPLHSSPAVVRDWFVDRLRGANLHPEQVSVVTPTVLLRGLS